MKISIVTITVLITMATTGCQMTNDQTQDQTAVFLLEAKALSETFLNQLLSADTTAFYDFLETVYIGENAELITSDGKIIKGNSLMAWYHEFFGPAFKYFNVEGKFYDENFIASGNMVIHRYSYQMNLTPKEGGETLTEVGHGIKIYQRSSDGNWKMLYDVWSNPE